jgi:hypothetical protein
VRHPYLTLAIFGLAAVGVISISDKVRGFCQGKARCVENMLSVMKKDENDQ